MKLTKSKLKQIIREEIQNLKEGNMSTEARELYLYTDNDGDLYRQKREPIQKNLMKKIEKGKYNSKLAVKLWMYLADDGAKKYVKDFGGTVKDMFPKKVRMEAAEAFAADFEEMIKVDEPELAKKMK